MDSRERVFLAIGHETPDRIPVDFWASAGFRVRIRSELGMSFEDFLDARDVDFRYIPGPSYIGPPLAGGQDEVSTDTWGVPRKTVTLQVGGQVERYREVVGPPLANATTTDEIDAYAHWPSADMFDYRDVESQCDHVRGQGRVVVFMGDRLNRVAQLKPAMYIRGPDRIMLDMALNPNLARALFSRIKTFYVDYLERILAAANGKIDIVLTGDDFGAQQGPLLSPEMWDAFLRQGFEEYVSLIKAHGAVAMHHTCGSVRALIPRMIDCGLDVLQSLQPEARGMEAAGLKQDYGDRLSFHGGVSIQKTLPYGTPEDVCREVKGLAEAMGEGGGYVFCTAHNVQADAPMANVLAMLDAYRRYGVYG